MIDDKGGPRRPRFKPKRLKTTLARPDAAEEPVPAPKAAERIAKVMARAGVASRREAEAWIAAGRVSVNGAAVASPAFNVTAADRIAVDGKPLPQRERTRLFLFHKPRGVLTTASDTHGRPTVFDVLPKELPRLLSVGRLDMNTEGLLLLTNDGGLARALELPATGWLRRYRVRAFGAVTQDRLDGLRNGIEVDGVRYGAIEATLDRVQGSNVWLTFAMREGKNREIRNVLRALDLHVNRLIRLSFGPFQLGELPDGAIEEVKTRTLREQIGPRLAAQAGADFSSDILPPRPAARDERPARPGKPGASRPSEKPSGQGKPGRPQPGRPQPGRSKPDRSQPDRPGPRGQREDRGGDKGGNRDSRDKGGNRSNRDGRDNRDKSGRSRRRPRDR